MTVYRLILWFMTYEDRRRRGYLYLDIALVSRHRGEVSRCSIVSVVIPSPIQSSVLHSYCDNRFNFGRITHYNKICIIIYDKNHYELSYA